LAIKKRKNKQIAFSYEGYKEYAIITKEAKEKTKNATKGFLNKINIFKKKEKPAKLTDFIIRGGPIKGTNAKISELLPNIPSNQLTPDMTKQVEKYWMPGGGLSVYDHKEKIPLTAAVAAKRHIDEKRWMPQYYQNPMQGYDYLVYESLLKNTILGPLAWSLVKFIIGTGFAPALELRNPSGDPKKDAELIKKHEYIINNLKYIDRCISEKSDEDGVDISFKMKMTNLIHNMLTFNRSCAVYQYDTKNPIKLNPLGPQNEGSEKSTTKPQTAKEKKKNPKGVKEYPNIPTGLVDFHPRDIGIVKISPTSKKMESVQINQIQGFVDYDQMIYMWNSQHAAPIHNAKYYGGSILMPMIEPARLIRTQVSSILPAVSENMAGGLYHIFVEPEGGTEAQRILEYESITQAAEFGTANVFMLAPDRVKYENVNFDPKIGDLITVFDTQIKYIIACFNLPQIGSYDEAAANHATAVEKIQLTISTAINPMREWIGEDFGRQWYNRNFLEIYREDYPEIVDLFRIKVDFEDLQVETLKERAETIMTMKDAGINIDIEKTEELMQIEGLKDHIEEPDPNELPEGPNRFQVKEKGAGSFSVKSS